MTIQKLLLLKYCTFQCPLYPHLKVQVQDSIPYFFTLINHLRNNYFETFSHNFWVQSNILPSFMKLASLLTKIIFLVIFSIISITDRCINSNDKSGLVVDKSKTYGRCISYPKLTHTIAVVPVNIRVQVCQL